MNPLVRDLYKRIISIGKDYPGKTKAGKGNMLSHFIG
jgi:hypothetical protein